MKPSVGLSPLLGFGIGPSPKIGETSISGVGGRAWTGLMAENMKKTSIRHGPHQAGSWLHHRFNGEGNRSSRAGGRDGMRGNFWAHSVQGRL